MIRALVFLSVTCLVLAANLWLISYARRAFFSSAPSVIAGIRVIGKDDTDGKLGITLAHMLVARLGKIDQEMRDAVRMLEAAENVTTTAGPRTLDVETADLVVPKEVFEPLDVAVSVGGVEVGGILSWLHRSVSERNLIQISVEFGESKALLAGVVGETADDSLYLEVDKTDNDTIISAAAYQMAQKSVARRIPEIGALEWFEFRELFLVLTQATKLNKSVALGADPGRGYAELSNKLDPIVAKMDEWKALVRFSGDLARTGNDLPKALAYYQQAQSLLKEGDSTYDQLGALIDEIQTQLAAITPTAVPPTTSNLSIESDDDDLKRILASPATATMLRQLGVTSREMKNSPTIAVFGGLPPKGTVPTDQMTIVSNTTRNQSSDPFMTEYVGTIVQTIKTVAPDSHFIFAPLTGKGGAFASSDMLRAIEQLAGQKPDILLLTVGPFRSEAEEQVLVRLADAGILTVLAAGNEAGAPIPLADKPIFGRMMVVSATKQDGTPAEFTQRGEKVYWAPGEAVPVVLRDKSQGEQGLTVRNGTTYAAAFGAAVAARVLAERPELDLPELLTLLRNTSKEAAAGGPKVLNVAAAVAALPPS